MSAVPMIFMGWDSRETLAYDVAEFSIKSRARSEVSITPLRLGALQEWLLTRPVEKKDGKLWCPISQAPMATEFAISRFCVPFLRSKGWALFVDCDIVCLADINKLFALADDKYAVMCVKHNHKPVEDDSTLYVKFPYSETGPDLLYRVNDDGVHRAVGQVNNPSLESLQEALGKIGLKMDGQIQTTYPRKNWSSVVLWNCGHPSNKKLTAEALNSWPGRDLHAFKWLADEEIGSLPVEWNYLVGVSDLAIKPKIAHFTMGGPWISGWQEKPGDEIWNGEHAKATS